MRLPASFLFKRPTLLRVALPLALSFVLTVLALTIMAQLSAKREDETELRNEIAVVSALVERLQADVGHITTAYSNWTEAYDKTRAPVDGPWIAENFGPAILGVQGVEGAYILDAQENRVYAMSEGREMPADAPQDEGIQAFARQIRKTLPTDSNDYIASIVSRHGRLHVLAGAFITPSQEKLFVADDPGRIAIFESEISPSVTHEFAQKFNIRDLDQTFRPGNHALMLIDSLGRTAGGLYWMPDRPGQRTLAQLLPVAGIILLLMTIANAVVLGGWLSMQSVLSKTQAQAAAATQANSTKNVLLAHLSHELRTPLNAIIGFSDLIESEAFGPTGVPQYRDYAAHIGRSGRELLEIVTRLLELARLERGESALALGPADACDIALKALDTARAKATTAGIVLHTEIEDHMPAPNCDPDATRRILEQLLDNAVKFTGRGGKVSLRAEAARNRASIVFMVEDNGIGIEQDRLVALQSPFAVSQDAYIRHQGGVGLGLSIARALTTLQGGQLELSSESGRGTRATLTLPVATPSASKGHAQTRDAA